MRLVAVILPDLGTGPDTPIVISYWFAARGKTVWEGDRLVEVLVGPSTFDVSAPATGRLVEIRAREDDVISPVLCWATWRHSTRMKTTAPFFRRTSIRAAATKSTTLEINSGRHVSSSPET